MPWSTQGHWASGTQVWFLETSSRTIPVGHGFPGPVARRPPTTPLHLQLRAPEPPCPDPHAAPRWVKCQSSGLPISLPCPQGLWGGGQALPSPGASRAWLRRRVGSGPPLCLWVSSEGSRGRGCPDLRDRSSRRCRSWSRCAAGWSRSWRRPHRTPGTPGWPGTGPRLRAGRALRRAGGGGVLPPAACPAPSPVSFQLPVKVPGPPAALPGTHSRGRGAASG